jgi:hypothetical protein
MVMLLRGFGPYGIIFICVITVAKVMLLRDFGFYVFHLHVGWRSFAEGILGPNGIICMMRVVITVAMVTLLRDFGPYGKIFMTVFTTLSFPVVLYG